MWMREFSFGLQWVEKVEIENCIYHVQEQVQTCL